jgi:hypothetical protein
MDLPMSRRYLYATAFAAVVLTPGPTSPAAFAAASDFKFVLVSARPAGPAMTDVTLRLTHVADAKPVSGAVIFQPKAVMAGMESIPGGASAEAGAQPGSYVLHVGTAMAGTWTLNLSAKVQGEPETLHAAIPFVAAQ